MNEQLLDELLVTMNDTFVDDNSKEVFMRRYLDVFSECKVITPKQEISCSEIAWEYVCDIYESILEELNYNKLKLGDSYFIEVSGDVTVSGKVEKVLVGVVETAPIELAENDVEMDHYAYDSLGTMHAYKGYYTFKN